MNEGEVVSLAGRNGAGKTTLVRCLIGLHRQAGGTVRLHGRDITVQVSQVLAAVNDVLGPSGA